MIVSLLAISGVVLFLHWALYRLREDAMVLFVFVLFDDSRRQVYSVAVVGPARAICVGHHAGGDLLRAKSLLFLDGCAKSVLKRWATAVSGAHVAYLCTGGDLASMLLARSGDISVFVKNIMREKTHDHLRHGLISRRSYSFLASFVWLSIAICCLC